MAHITSIVIFGASGDLTRRKLIPALFNLCRKGRLDDTLRIVGYAIDDWSDAQYRTQMQAAVDRFAGYEYTRDEWDRFQDRLSYVPGSFTQTGDYGRLQAHLTELEHGPANRLYYLATPPRFFVDIVNCLGNAAMTSEEEGWRRVVIEKPFGRDLASAQALNAALHKVVKEDQIYRIDHYLGKETVQNVLVFRFANAMYEPIWNRNYVDHVQISVLEEVGVGHRAGYYEQAGVIRDMFQNHLMQLLCMVAMEPPVSFSADAIRDEKVKVLKAVRPVPIDQVADNAVRAQYEDYRQEPGVAADSQTASYAAMRLYVDNWRWQDVPFYLRSGKKLAEKVTEVLIQFKCPPHLMFRLPPGSEIPANYISLCIQPDEGIHQQFEVKVPDTEADMASVDMDFHYGNAFGPNAIPEAYERLLLEALRGDASLFTRNDQIEVAWSLMDPILDSFAKGQPPLVFYKSDSWGPEEADRLLAHNGRAWQRGCGGHGLTAATTTEEHEPQGLEGY